MTQKTKSKPTPRVNYDILRKGGAHGKSTKARRRNDKVRLKQEES